MGKNDYKIITKVKGMDTTSARIEKNAHIFLFQYTVKHCNIY